MIKFAIKKMILSLVCGSTFLIAMGLASDADAKICFLPDGEDCDGLVVNGTSKLNTDNPITTPDEKDTCEDLGYDLTEVKDSRGWTCTPCPLVEYPNKFKCTAKHCPEGYSTEVKSQADCETPTVYTTKGMSGDDTCGRCACTGGQIEDKTEFGYYCQFCREDVYDAMYNERSWNAGQYHYFCECKSPKKEVEKYIPGVKYCE